MKVAIFIFLLFCSGCASGISVVKAKYPGGSATPTAPVAPVVPFEDIDVDNTGSINIAEYYDMAREVNTTAPVWALILILSSVLLCTIISALTLRPKR
jgi:hypothetical protein